MSNQRYFTTKGLILKKQPSGENDWFLTVFTPEHGKIQAICRSSRKITSQKGGHLDPLNLCDFQFYRNGDRLLITECKVENAHQEIKSNLEKTAAAFSVLELLLRTIQTEDQNPALFTLTLKTLEKLSQTLGKLHLEKYKIQLLQDSGSWPDLSRCHFCQTVWQPESLIATDAGGHLTCQNCLHLTHVTLENIPYNIIKLARFLADQNSPDLNIAINPQQLFQLKKLVNIFLLNYLQDELKSTKIIL